jgi:cytochrome b6-f complex iron-sulfur subunit
VTAGAVIAVVVGVVVVLGAASFVSASRSRDLRGAGVLSRETIRRDRESQAVGHRPPISGRDIERAVPRARMSAVPAPVPRLPAPFVPPDPEAVGVSRRQFFNRAAVSLTSAGAGTLAAAAVIAFLWPAAQRGFGGKIAVGMIDDILVTIRNNDGFLYVPEGRAWITAYPADALPKARSVYSPTVYQGMEAGIVALYQRCPHLGCRVPECKTSQWFECPCHGSTYNRVGEKKGGPAPRGMDRFGVTVNRSGDVTVDTGAVVTGPTIGTNTTGQEAEGPHCVGIAEHRG